MSGTSQDLGLYSPMFFKVNGNICMEEVSIQLTIKSNAQKVFTVPKGAAGLSLGAADCDGTLTSAVPLAGVEVPGGVALDQAMLGLQTLEFDLVVGEQNCTFNGFIMEEDLKHASQQKSEVVYRIWGEAVILA